MRIRLWPLAAVALLAVAPLHADDGQALKELLQDHALQGDWIYDDVEAGLLAASKSGKPLLISFRCVP